MALPPKHRALFTTFVPPSPQRIVSLPCGFTLIELLVVVAVIGLLAAAAIPAFQSIGKARGVTEAGYQFAAAVELARAEAMARGTLTWLATERTEVDGNRALKVGIIASRDASTSTDAANLAPIGPVVVLEQVDLVSHSDTLPGAINFVALDGFGFQVGRHTFTNAHMLAFTPGGEATKELAPGRTTGFTPVVAARLVGSRGTSLDTNNPVDILIDGSTGMPTLTRK